MGQEFLKALVNADGSIVMTFRWADPYTPCPWRWFWVQMLDEEMKDIPQPYETPPEAVAEFLGDEPVYTQGARAGQRWPRWVVNMWEPPSGLTLVSLSPDDWLETEVDQHAKVWDGERMTVRPGHVRMAHEGRLRRYVRPIGGEHLQRALPHEQHAPEQVRPRLQFHYVRGGTPAYYMRAESPLTELDFPHLDFHHIAAKRKAAVSPAELSRRHAREQEYRVKHKGDI
jgi:hypothetical protein